MATYGTPMTARDFIAHGHVQGVVFRESLRRAAEARGVAGSARNLPDGTVHGTLEGEAADVEALLDVIRGGPGSATVSALDVSPAEVRGLQGFTTG